MNDFIEHTIDELQDLINKAQSALKHRQHEKKQEVVAQIQKLAKSINASVEIKFEDDSDAPVRKSNKVAPRYRNPDQHDQTWTGRGIKPKWIQKKLDEGHQLDDFLI